MSVTLSFAVPRAGGATQKLGKRLLENVIGNGFDHSEDASIMCNRF